MSLRLKMSLVFSVSLAILLFLVGFALYMLFAEREWEQLDTTLERTAQEVSRSVTIREGLKMKELLLFPYQEVILPDVDVFTFPNTYIQVVRLDGKIAARSSSLGSVRLPLWPPLLAAASRGERAVFTAEVSGHHLRVLGEPLLVDDSPIGLIIVASATQQVEETLTNLRLLLILMFALVTVLLALFIWWLTGQMFRPLMQLVHEVSEVKSGADLKRRISLNSSRFFSARSADTSDASDASRTNSVSQKTDASSMTPLHARHFRRSSRDEIILLADSINDMLGRLEEAYTTLDRSLKTQRRFVADASHQFRTPLTALRGNIEMLRSEVNRMLKSLSNIVDDLSTTRQCPPELYAVNPKIIEYDQNEQEIRFDAKKTAEALKDLKTRVELAQTLVGELFTDTERLVEMAEHMLTLARREAGYGHEHTLFDGCVWLSQVEERLHGLDPNVWKQSLSAHRGMDHNEQSSELSHVGTDQVQCIETSDQSVQTSPARFADHRLSWHIDLTRPCIESSWKIQGDPEALRLALWLVLENALRYTKSGEIIVGATIERDEQRFLKLFVEDQGIGIPEDALEHIFERFYRAPNATGEVGSGLGLSIVKEIIEGHGGHVQVKSQLGVGTRLELKLPIVVTDM